MGDSNDQEKIPDEIKDFVANQESDGVGVSVFHSPLDQSSCDHLKSGIMNEVSTIKEGRCNFYEPFGGSYMWVVMDEYVYAPADGKYMFAMYEQNGYTAKASFACCDWPEDFITRFDIPEPTCEVCGAVNNPAWASLFYEQKTMERYGGYPPLQNCDSDSTPIPL